MLKSLKGKILAKVLERPPNILCYFFAFFYFIKEGGIVVFNFCFKYESYKKGEIRSGNTS